MLSVSGWLHCGPLDRGPRRPEIFCLLFVRGPKAEATLIQMETTNEGAWILIR